MKKNKLKFLDKGNYFEIGDITDEGVKVLGRFMELTVKSLEDILESVKKDIEIDTIKKYYNEYVREIKNHNLIVKDLKATFKNIMNPKEIEKIVREKDKSLTFEGFYAIHHIVCNNLFLS